jgi:hypothetical protein
MKYEVFWSESLEELERFVVESMGKGWRPQGGVSHDGEGYMQAMVLSQ